MYSTHQTQEACPRLCRLHGSHPATSARSYQVQIGFIAVLKVLDHQVDTDDLSDARNDQGKDTRRQPGSSGGNPFPAGTLGAPQSQHAWLSNLRMCKQCGLQVAL